MTITPPAGFRKGLTLMLAACAVLAGFATPAQAATPTVAAGEQIVNGDFEYMSSALLAPSLSADGRDSYSFVDPAHGQRLAWPGDTSRWKWVDVPGFDRNLFGWTSSQTDDPSNLPQRAGAVEIQRDLDGNTYGEITASQKNTADYQTIRTTPGVSYTVQLDHASLYNTHVDGMQVLIGPPGSEQPIRMTRVTSNTAGDETGVSDTVIRTTATNEPEVGGFSSRNHAGQWATYRGTYIATSDTTVFTFRAYQSWSKNVGNLIDDVSFQIGYPLAYSANGGAGTLPKQTN